MKMSVVTARLLLSICSICITAVMANAEVTSSSPVVTTLQSDRSDKSSLRKSTPVSSPKEVVKPRANRDEKSNPKGKDKSLKEQEAVAAAAPALPDGTISPNAQSAAIKVEPFSGSANLSVPIQVVAGRGGIQPSLAFSYNSSIHDVGIAGVGWRLDLGSIQRSIKRGVPSYDDLKDIFAFAGKDLVKDSVTGRFYMEVEGAFAKIERISDHWEMTDKKGTKYYFGNTDDSRQYDPSNLSHVFSWNLNRVEDIQGNFMTITYIKDGNKLYPQAINYGGNSKNSLPHFAKVEFNYTPIATPNISYITGFRVASAQRINTINVLAAGTIQRIYTFNYQNSASTQKPLLKSVQQSVLGGQSLPPVSFTYTDQDTPSFQSASGWQIPSDLALNYSFNSQLVDAGIRVMDVNGDGYSDFVRSFFVAGNSSVMSSYTYLNGKNNGWTSSNNWKLDPNSAPFSYIMNYANPRTYSGVLSADMNGDGYVDVFGSGEVFNAGGTSVCKGVYFGINSSNTFTQDANWQAPSVSLYKQSLDGTCKYDCPQVSNGVALGDVNGDGFLDQIQSSGTTSTNHGVYMNQMVQGSKNFAVNNAMSLPANAYTDFTQGATLVDLNGDGLADIFYLKGGVAKAFLNTAAGWQETGEFENTLGFGDLTDASTQLMDINEDGLVDIVIANGSSARVLINNGSAWFQDNRWVPQGANFTNHSTQYLDANGDGMQDYLNYSYNQSPQLYLNTTRPADLLVSALNGIGASSTINYESSSHYSNTFMPFVAQVVKSTTITDAFSGNSYTTQYSYANGKWDATYREFQGFGMVKIIDADGNYATTTFVQDHWLKGYSLEQSSYDVNGNLYSKSVNQWQAQTILTNSTSNQTSKFVFLQRTDNYLYDGTTSAKRTAQEITYAENPQYGNPTQVINYGEVDATTGADVGSDKTIYQPQYLYNTSSWIIGLPNMTLAKDFDGNIISKTWFYYDYSTNNIATPTAGLLTAKTSWLGDATQVDPTTKYSYNSYGNLLTTTDPLGHVTTIAYDNDVQNFPVIITNELNQYVITKYYGVDDGSAVGGKWGQLENAIDPNGQTVSFQYDVFGRPTLVIGPLDSLAKPSDKTSYEQYSTYTKVTNKSRIENGGDQTIDSVSYYDGLGRMIESKSLGPNAGQYIVGGQVEYNNRGLPIKQYQPRFTTSDLNTIDPIDPATPFSQILYDAMGRVVKTINPDESYANVQYDHWTTIIYDENGHKQRSIQDAFGRLIQKEEYRGADGRASDYPLNTYTLYATTTYEYDPSGNLSTVRDAKGNETKVFYDRLNRKIGMDDPDMGVWSYGYDANSNLIWQKDAKGQTVRFSYDELNRLLNKTDGIPSGPINNFPTLPPVTPSFHVAYQYDSTAQTYGKGRLGDVAYDFGSAGFTYDLFGREIGSTKRIDSTTYSVNRQYDALNRLKQIQYPDGAEVKYLYNQAGQVVGVADAGAVVNGQLVMNASSEISNTSQLAWVKRYVLGVKEAYAANPNSPPTVTLTSPFNNATYSAWADVYIAANASDSDGTIAKVEFFNETTLIGTDTTSPYSMNWTHVGPGNFSVTAKAMDNSGATTVSAPFTIRVVASADIAPIIAPVNNSTFSATSNITLRAIPISSYGPIDKVEFYKEQTLLGTVYVTDSDSLYTYIWNTVPAGSYSLSTKTYNNGLVGASSSVNITVTPSGPAPTVNLTSPLNNTSFQSPGPIALSASATVSSGRTISKIEFYNGITLIGTDTTAPYSYNWTNVPAGQYAITAKVIDNTGSAGISSISNVTIAPAKLTAGLGIEIDHIIVVGTTLYSTTPGTVKIDASGTIALGSITRLEIYNGTTLLGSSTTPPYTYTWSNIPPGSYSFSSKVYSGAQVATSDSFQVTIVNPSGLPPTVSLNSPNGSLASPANVMLTTNALPTNGPGGTNTISKVEFYNGTTLVGTATSAPFSLNWTGVSQGSYSVTAKAFDNNNNTATSNAVTVKVTAPNQFIRNVDYNALGQVTQIQYGNGVTTAYTYYPRNNRLKRIYTSNAQALRIQDLTYTYDAGGQIMSIVDGLNTATQSFKYDELNRLIWAQGSYGTKTYVYDEIGNITQKDGLTYAYAEPNSRIDAGLPAGALAKAGPHAVTSLSDGSVFKYDSNGNMVKLIKGVETTLYNYDVQNRLTSVSSQTTGSLAINIAQYVYDSDGERTKKTVYRRDKALYNVNTGTLLFGSLTNPPKPATAQNRAVDTTRYVGQLYEEQGTRHTKFIYLGSSKIAAVTGPEVMYYHTDHLGGTNALTDLIGLPRELTEYDPFGLVIKHEKYGNDFATAWSYFTGKQLDDETGLIYFGARYYNPKLGRFITPDSKIPSLTYSQAFNRYAYCYNNPVNFIDPDGHSPISAAIGVAFGGYHGFLSGLASGNIGGAIVGGISGAGIGLLLGFWIGDTPAGMAIVGAASSLAGNTIGNAINNHLSKKEQSFMTVAGPNAFSAALGGASLGRMGAPIQKYLAAELGLEYAKRWTAFILLSPAIAIDGVTIDQDKSGTRFNNYISNQINSFAFKSNSVSTSVSSPISAPTITPSAPPVAASSSASYGGIGPAWNTKTYGNTWMQQTYGPSINDGSLNYDSGASFVGDGLSNGSNSVSHFRSGNGGSFPGGMSNGPRGAGFGDATSVGIYGPGIQYAGASSSGGGGRGGGGMASGTPIITIRFDNEM